jgi:hypothetical protein
VYRLGAGKIAELPILTFGVSLALISLPLILLPVALILSVSLITALSSLSLIAAALAI